MNDEVNVDEHSDQDQSRLEDHDRFAYYFGM